ncbi:MAG: hypothetical protein ACREH8_10540 [Opitutaceae bacterium]
MTNQELGAAIKRNPVSFTCVLLSCILAGLIYFRHGAIPAAEQQLAQKTDESQKISLNMAYSAQLKEQAETIEAANKEIAARMVRASQLGTNTQYFYTLESGTGVKILDLRQTTPSTVARPARGAFLPVAFSISVQSDLNHILTFLQQLENGAHFCRVLTATCSGNSAMRTAPLTLALTVELLGTP